MRPSTADKFWGNVEFTDTCWLWQGWTNRESGYGNFWLTGVGHVYVHVYSYEFCVGDIPEGYEIDHSCRTHNCVCPDHLEAVTHGENVRRGVRARQEIRTGV